MKEDEDEDGDGDGIRRQAGGARKTMEQQQEILRQPEERWDGSELFDRADRFNIV
ncbi:uncharacterized protein ARB_06290 [Trichophyton benhamiae CBS 112371]|uniref:Uncharacterized protein n=1 Tax=Arthroderma benhamiae (strain ATCC MYA-4681 / CBS 112371) TaxID=663331 RepID=D4APY3_ARTBC|nr:uncharacterized protein ARB_06290 [Trichophyton benhamiae CBS 112371]EFE34527.1 hypothetical protein ARB_06290 [Trichophyton benhamiae CBS 112371]